MDAAARPPLPRLELLAGEVQTDQRSSLEESDSATLADPASPCSESAVEPTDRTAARSVSVVAESGNSVRPLQLHSTLHASHFHRLTSWMLSVRLLRPSGTMLEASVLPSEVSDVRKQQWPADGFYLGHGRWVANIYVNKCPAGHFLLHR